MPDQLQLRGGTTTEHNSFTGAAREVTVDTTKKTLVVHDGSQAGGTPLMKESGGNAASTVQIGVGGSNKLTINSDGHIDIASNLDCAAGLDVTGGGLTVNSGTTNTCATFTSTDSGAVVNITDSHTRSSIEQNNTDLKIISDTDAGDANSTIKFLVDNSTKMLINHLGNVGIGTTTIADDTDHCKLAISGQSGTAAGILIFQDASNNEDGMIFADNGNLYIAADRSNNTADSTIRFRVDGSSEKARIDHVGRLLIGETSSLMNESGFNEILIGGKNEGAAIHLQDNNGNVKGGMFTSDQSLKMFIRTVTNHPIEFRTNNTNVINIDTSGNFLFQKEAASNYPTQQIKWSNDSTTTNGFYIAQHSDRHGRIWHEQGLSLNFGTNNQLRMTIDPNGNVGIGTTSPARKLEVHDTNATVLALNSTNSSGTTLRIQNSGTDKMFLGLAGDFITGQSANVTDSAIRASGALLFATGGGSERMRINSSGDVHIARTDTLALGANNVTGINLLASGRILASSNGSQSEFGRQGSNGEVIRFACQGTGNVGSIDVTTSSTSYNTSSDYRLKENITAISDGITRLKTLKPSRFNFKIDKDKTVDGFLAHEVTAVPEAITGTKDEVATEDNELAGVKKGDPIYQKIDQSKLIPLLVAAVQELIGKVEVLEAA